MVNGNRFMVVAAVTLIDMDAAGLDPGEFFEIGDDRPQGVAVERVAAQRLGMEHELAALRLGYTNLIKC